MGLAFAKINRLCSDSGSISPYKLFLLYHFSPENTRTGREKYTTRPRVSQSGAQDAGTAGESFKMRKERRED